MVGFRERRGRDGLRPRVFKSDLLSGVAAAALRPQNVFATSLYTGNTATSTLNGPDLLGKGGQVHIKGRTLALSHYRFSTLRGGRLALTPTTGAEGAASGSDGVSSYPAEGGFQVTDTANGSFNLTARSYVAWQFAQADKFMKTVLFSHTTGTDTTIDLSSLGVVGSVWIKSRNVTGDWYAWHRSLTAGQNIRYNTTAAQSAINAYVSVSGTTVTLTGAAPTANYELTGWAHDTSTDGIIQCGSFTGTGATVTLGWRPQYLEFKAISNASDWFILDTQRGWGSGNDNFLYSNTTGVENALYGDVGGPTLTGFVIQGLPNDTYAYRAIRESNFIGLPKPQDVYSAVNYTSTGAAQILRTGVDLASKGGFIHGKNRSAIGAHALSSTFRGVGKIVVTNGTGGETADPTGVTAFNSDGVSLGTGASGFSNNATNNTYIAYSFAQGDKFMKMGLFTHTNGVASSFDLASLGIVGEVWVKRIDAGGDWYVWHRGVGNGANLRLNTSGAQSSVDPFITVTGTTVTFAALAAAGNYEITGWAHDPSPNGIIRCGSYIGTGTASTIIPVGWKPQYLVVKYVPAADSWVLTDATRAAFSNELYFNGNQADTGGGRITASSAGFTLTSASGLNSGTQLYIYRAIRENFPLGSTITWNPSDKDAGITLSGDNLIATRPGSGNSAVRSTIQATGKRYLEWQFTQGASAGGLCFGLLKSTDSLTSFVSTVSVGLSDNGTVALTGTSQGNVGGFAAASHVGMMAIDTTTGKVWFGRNGIWLGDPWAGTGGVTYPTGALFAAFSGFNGSDQVTVNFGQSGFSYPVPTGFLPWA